MRIVHISDLHWRTLKFHPEYQSVFQNFYRELDELKPDLVVNTGDTAHSKTALSPELVDCISIMHREIAKRTRLEEILGNHDLNLMNIERQDAISPIVQSIGDPRIRLHKKSGLAWSEDFDCGRVNLWIFAIGDQKNYPTPSDWEKYPDDINIGLFHGSVSGCVTDQNFMMTGLEHDQSMFEGLDFVLLGDIHKRQSFNGGRIWYAGSMIQQNFGEDPDKGFLVWDIHGKDDWKVTPVTLEGARKFYTVTVGDNLVLPDQPISEGSRLRISPSRELTISEQKELSKAAREKYSPHDVIILSSSNIGLKKASVVQSSMEDLRKLPVQERLIREFFQEQGLTEEMLTKILDLNRKYHVQVEKDDENVRNITWKIDRIEWGNVFNYGEENFVDFSALGGVTGLFAPNASGKSSFIDILTETCFDAITKGVPKNVMLINDNKEEARMSAAITANGEHYIIDRKIERLKHETKKAERLEWGKTTVDFSALDEVGDRQSLVGDLRPETEKNIRQRLGSFDDFMLTSLSAQWNPQDLIACRETERKKILYRFLDLDGFEKKGAMAKAESKELFSRLSSMEEANFSETAGKLQEQLDIEERQLMNLRSDLSLVKEAMDLFDQSILEKVTEKVKILDTHDPEKLQLTLDQLQRETSNSRGNIARHQLELEKKIESIREIAQHLVEFPASENAAEKHKQIAEDIAKTRDMLKDLEREQQNHEKNLIILRQVPCGDQFPECKFLTNAFESRKKLESIRVDADTFRNLLEELNRMLAEIEAAYLNHQQHEFWRERKRQLETEISRQRLQVQNDELELKTELEHVEKVKDELVKIEQSKEDLQRNARLDADISEMKRKKFSQVVEMKKIEELISELDRLIGGHSSILEKIKKEMLELQDLRNMASAYEHYIEAMGKDGIAHQILAQKLPLINQEINKILASSTDFSVFIEHDPQEQSVRFFLQYGQYKSRLLELGSGAEKFLASLAIRTALLSISSLPKTNMFIIDEGFGKLDAARIESVSKMFDYLRTVFDHIIIISHTDLMKDLVDNSIDIVADEEGYAKISVGEQDEMVS